MGSRTTPEAIRSLLGSLVTDLPADTSVDLLDTGLIDSLTLLEVVDLLERELEVSFPESSLRADCFRSVDAIAATVAGLAEGD